MWSFRDPYGNRGSRTQQVSSDYMQTSSSNSTREGSTGSAFMTVRMYSLTVSRIVLICLMFFGRVGGLTFVFAAFNPDRVDYSAFPLEKINIG